MNEKHEQLIADYLAGNLDRAGKTEVEELIAAGEINFMEFRELEKIHEELGSVPVPKPSTDLSSRFYAMLEEEKRSVQNNWLNSIKENFRALMAEFTIPRLAYAVMLLIIGGFIGSQLNGNQNEIEQISQEMQELKQLMMVNMLEGSSAADRLKAVNISSEFTGVDTEAIQALLFTLNHDSSINVRVQAIEALKRWGEHELVREGLVRSIARQESPIVIIELADAMIELELRSSASEFEKLLEERELDYTVQQKLQSSIAVLM